MQTAFEKTVPHHILAIMVAGGIITVLHATGPDHWLPHVLVSKAQGWSLGRTLRITLVAALGHVGLTLLLGFLILYLLVEVELLSESLTLSIAALALLVGGAIFLARGLLRRPHAHKKVMSDGAAVMMLVLVAAFPPCYAILPLFLAISAFGWELGLSMALLFSILTIGVMVSLVVAGRRGYAVLERRGWLQGIEERQDLIIGGVFVMLAGLLWFGL